MNPWKYVMSMTLRNVSTFRQKNNKNISPSEDKLPLAFLRDKPSYARKLINTLR